MKVWLTMAAIVAAAGATAVYAVAGHGSGSVASYTGCLKLANGTIKNVAEGGAPSAACGNGELEIHLGGGDISAVTASDGLQGGGANGSVGLGIQPSFRLPQGCQAGHVAKWSAGAWACATDIDTNSGGDITGVTAGVGLTGGAPSGNALLELAAGYRLPQGCASGQVAKVNAGTWSCAADANTTYTGANFARSSQSCSSGFVQAIDSGGGVVCAAAAAGTLGVTQVTSTAVSVCGDLDPACTSIGSAVATCPAGSVVTGGGFFTNGDPVVYASHQDGNGWRVSIDNDNPLTGASVLARAMCLTLS